MEKTSLKNDFMDELDRALMKAGSHRDEKLYGLLRVLSYEQREELFKMSRALYVSMLAHFQSTYSPMENDYG